MFFDLFKWAKPVLAIAALGLSFNPILASVNPDGSLSHTVAIKLPPAKVAPSLGISYNSNSDNGMLGMGWSLSGISQITRIKYGGGIDYDGEDTYAGPNGRLIDVSGDESYYHYANENWSRLEPEGMCGDGPCKWTEYLANGVVRYYGARDANNDCEDENACITAIEHDGQTETKQCARVWALYRVEDANGNYYEVTYDRDHDNGDYYPELVEYTKGPGITKGHTIHFELEERIDHEMRFLQSAKVDSDQRISKIHVRSDGDLVRSYHLGYNYSPSTGRSLLSNIQELVPNKGNESDLIGLPKTILEYTEQEFGWDRASRPPRLLKGSGTFFAPDFGRRVADVNGDGFPDVIEGYINISPDYNDQQVFLNNKGLELVPASYENPTHFVFEGSNDAGVRVVDVNGDGLPDLIMALRFLDHVYKTYLNTGNGWVEDDQWKMEKWHKHFVFSAERGLRMADLNGDQLPDFIFGFESAWHVLRKTRMNTPTGWGGQDSNFLLPEGESFVKDLGPYNGDMGVRIVDLNGDGLPDLIRGYHGSDNKVWPYRWAKLNTGDGFVDAPEYRLPIDPNTSKYAAFIRELSDSTDDRGIRFVDLNGDALPDIVRSFRKLEGLNRSFAFLNTGSGWLEVAQAPPSDWENAILFSGEYHGYGTVAGGLFGMDINGDNRTDWINGYQAPFVRTVDASNHFNLPNGCPDPYSPTCWELGDRAYENSTIIRLFPGNEPIDVRYFKPPTIVMNQETTVRSHGNVRCSLEKWRDECIDYLQDEGVNYIFKRMLNKRLHIIDFNADGLQDMLMDNQIYTSKGPFPDLLRKIKNGKGAIRKISYTPAAHVEGAIDSVTNTCGGATGTGYGQPCGVSDKSVRHLVTRVLKKPNLYNPINTGDTPVPESQSFRYSYKNGRYYPGKYNERISLGFEEIRITNVQKNSYTVNRYYQDKRFPGALRQSFEYVQTDKLVKRTTHPIPQQYACGGTGCLPADDLHLNVPKLVLPTGRNTTVTYYLNGITSKASRKYSEVLEYDNFGNAVRIKNYDVKGGHTELIHTKYINQTDAGARFIGVKYEEATYNSLDMNLANQLSLTRTFYDGNGDLDNQILTKMQPTRTSVWDHDTVYVDTENTYNSAGFIGSSSLQGVTSSFEYDSFGLRSKLTRSAGGKTFESSLVNDPRFGTAISETDHNGLRVEVILDSFGRSRSISHYDNADELIAKTTFDSNQAAGYQQQCQHYGDTLNQGTCRREYHDGYGRPAYSISHAVDGDFVGFVAVKYEHDGWGRLHKQSAPYYVEDLGDTTTQPTQWYTKIFDLFNRIRFVHYPDGSRESYYYNYYDPASLHPGSTLLISKYDREQRVTRTFYDSRGLITKIGQAVHSTEESNIEYVYNSKGRLESVTSPVGITQVEYYANSNRRYRITDPNTGVTEYAYVNDPTNPAYGQIESVTTPDPNGGLGTVETSFEYNDPFGRLTAKDGGDFSINYNYDETEFAFGFGNLTSQEFTDSRHTTVNKFAYDIYGRSIFHNKKITLSGGYKPVDHSYQTAYDELGRVKKLTYPDSSEYNVSYIGGLAAVASFDVDGDTQVSYSSYNLFGTPTKTTLANGVETDYQFDEFYGVVKNFRTHNGSDDYVHTSYDHTPFGNLETITDHVIPQRSRTMAYDRLNRIRSVTRDDAVTFNYEFDNKGNLTNKNGVALTYATNSTKLESDGTNIYSHSDNGNMIEKGDTGFVYDEQNMLTRISQAGSDVLEFLYDESENRIAKQYQVDANTVINTYYVGSGYEIREKWVDGSLDSKQVTRHYMGQNGQRVVSFTTGDDLQTASSSFSNHQYFATMAPLYGGTLLTDLKSSFYRTLAFVTAEQNWILLGQALLWLLIGCLIVAYLRYVFGLHITLIRGRAAFLDYCEESQTLISIRFGAGYLVFGRYEISEAHFTRFTLQHSTLRHFVFLATFIFFGGGCINTGPEGIGYQTGVHASITGDTSGGLPLGERYYTHVPGNGATLVTDENGYEIQRIAYSPYGEIDQDYSGVWDGTEILNTEDQVTHKYTGQEFDPEAGLYYYNARYYDPTTGNFTSADTIIPAPNRAMAYNRHMYVEGNPINNIDPSGHSSWSDSAIPDNGTVGWGQSGGSGGGGIPGWVGIGVIIGSVVAGAVIGYVVDRANGGDGERGAVLGGLIGLGVGSAASFAGGLVGTHTASVAQAAWRAADAYNQTGEFTFNYGTTVAVFGSSGADGGIRHFNPTFNYETDGAKVSVADDFGGGSVYAGCGPKPSMSAIPFILGAIEGADVNDIPDTMTAGLGSWLPQFARPSFLARAARAAARLGKAAWSAIGVAGNAIHRGLRYVYDTLIIYPGSQIIQGATWLVNKLDPRYIDHGQRIYKNVIGADVTRRGGAFVLDNFSVLQPKATRAIIDGANHMIKVLQRAGATSVRIRGTFSNTELAEKYGRTAFDYTISPTHRGVLEFFNYLKKSAK